MTAKSEPSRHRVDAPDAEPNDDSPLLSVDSLSVRYNTGDNTVEALRDVSIGIDKGEMLGIAGESGSGKSTLALSILQYLGASGTITDGSVTLDGTSLLDMSPSELRSIRGDRIAHVPQDPEKALNPSIRVGEQIAETIRLHRDVSREEAMAEVYDLLERLNISEPEYNAQRYPHELSGGMQQRIHVAIALSCNPDLLILDEPTTGLDVTTEAKILRLLGELKDEFETSFLLITHDLRVMAEVVDRVGLLYAGELMEVGPVEDIFDDPAHPYTRSLLSAVPEVDVQKEITPIPGRIPDLTDVSDGCIFADRCSFAEPECRSGHLDAEAVDGNPEHTVRCRRWETIRGEAIRSDATESTAKTSGDPIVEVADLHKYYDEGSIVQRIVGDSDPVKAVSGVSFTIYEGETLALVGESGCGKSTLGRCLLGLIEPTSGEIAYRGQDIDALADEALRTYNRETSIVFQNPDSSLNPRKTVYESVSRPLELYTDQDQREQRETVLKILEEVGLSGEYASRLPHELSGGEKQRVCIARAFVSNPSFVVLDEPVSALDVSVQASILDLLDSLREKYDTAYLLISHDISVVNHISDRVGVMYLGKLVEQGERADVFEPPHHPYTRALLSSNPTLDPDSASEALYLDGDVPSARDPPNGCAFHTRCPQYAGDVCRTDLPTLESATGSDSHEIACHLDKSDLSLSTEEVAKHRSTK